MVNRVDKIEAHTVNLIQSNSLFSRYTKDINNNKLKFTYDFDVSCPPFPNKMTYRTKLVNEITKDIKENNAYYNIKGEIGTGKTQLCNQIVKNLNRNIFWFRIRDYKDNLKSFFNEIKKLINNKSLNPLKLIFKELSIPKNSIIVLDDLPNLANLNLQNELKILFDICIENNVLIISTSNYAIHNNILQYLNVKYINYEIPEFNEDETKELMRLYKCPEKYLCYAKLINIYSDSHPSFILATINYFVSKEWVLDFVKFMNNKFIDDEIKNFQLLLTATVSDIEIRELAYRLNTIGRTITDDDIRIVSSIKPEINFPFEKLNHLLDVWIYKESEKEYLLSPILYKLGGKNLGNETYKKINIELAENLIRKKVLDQFSFNKAFTYLICAEEYNKAGYLLVTALFSIINNKELKEEDISFIHYIWKDTPFPKEMDSTLKVLIKGLQIIIQHKFENNTDKLYKDFLELEERSNYESHYLLLLPYILFSIHRYPISNIRTKIRNLINSMPEEIKASMMIEYEKTGLTLNNFFILNLESIDSYVNLNEWINTVESYDKNELEKIFKQDFGVRSTFCELLIQVIKKNLVNKIDKNKIEELYNLLNKFAKKIYKKQVYELWESIAILLINCLLKLEKYDDAIKLKDSFIQIRDNKKFKLNISNEIAFKYVDIGKYDDAILILKNYLDLNIDNINVVNTYYSAAISYSNLNNFENGYNCFKKVLEVGNEIVDNLYRARVLGEFSILLWENNKFKECVNVCKEIYLLIDNQKEFTDDWKTIYLILGNHIAYFSSKNINTITDKLTKPTSRSYEYTAPHKELLDLYDEKKKCFFFYHFYNISSTIGDKENSIFFLNKSFEESMNSNNYDLKTLILIDYYSFNLNEIEYLQIVLYFIKKIGQSCVLYFLPYIIKLINENNLEKIIAFKNEILKVFTNETLEQQYIDSIIYISDSLINKINYSKEKGDWITNRFELIYELTKCNLSKAIEIQTKLNEEFFTGEYKNIFSEFQRNMILKEYFFNYWLNKLDTEKDSFRYRSILKTEVDKLYKKDIETFNKITALVRLIDNYIIR